MARQTGQTILLPNKTSRTLLNRAKVWFDPFDPLTSAMKDALLALYDFEGRVMIGYGVCVIVLAYSGLRQLIIGLWRTGFLNLLLAAIAAWVIFTTNFAMS